MVGSGMFSPKIKCDRFGSDCSEKNVIGSVQTGFFKIFVHDRFGNLLGPDRFESARVFSRNL
jgi:hypothetical protein